MSKLSIVDPPPTRFRETEELRVATTVALICLVWESHAGNVYAECFEPVEAWRNGSSIGLEAKIEY